MARNAKLNKFNLTHSRGASYEPGYLYPVSFFECLPGDVFKIQSEFLLRFMPTIAPLMNRFKVSLRWWYCPTRLLMDDWQKFITGGPDGQDATVLPYVVAPEGGWPVGSLMDHFSEQVGVAGLDDLAFAARMYDLVYNEWYRAESVQDPVALSLASGLDTTTNLNLLKVNWSRDYFTDGLPAPQKGPSIGLFGSDSVAPVVGNGNSLGLANGVYDGALRGISTSSGLQVVDGVSQPIGTTSGTVSVLANNKAIGVSQDPAKSGMHALLSGVDDATINAFRNAAAVQQFQELNMRGGNRYVEFIFNHFGVRTPDASLQRPQYVGGVTSNIMISEVLQTSSTDSTSPQGTMAGHGVGAGNTPVIKFRSLEYGYMMCLMSIQPDAIYHQGTPRHLMRKTRFDFAIPLLAHLGEQAIYNRELFAQGPSVTDANGNVVDNKPFAYNPRYEEYRRIPNSICGQLRSTLNFWTASRTFANKPELNSEFLESNPPTNFWAVENGTDHIVGIFKHHIPALRPLPKYGQPGLHII